MNRTRSDSHVEVVNSDSVLDRSGLSKIPKRQAKYRYIKSGSRVQRRELQPPSPKLRLPSMYLLLRLNRASSARLIFGKRLTGLPNRANQMGKIENQSLRRD